MPKISEINFKQFQKILFIAVGSCLVMITLWWGISIFQFTRRAEVVPGVVSKLNDGGSHPEIKFIARGGKEIEYAQGGLIAGYQVGETVNVLYEEQNPWRACVDSFGALWGFPVLGLLLGLVFIVVGLLLIR